MSAFDAFCPKCSAGYTKSTTLPVVIAPHECKSLSIDDLFNQLFDAEKTLANTLTNLRDAHCGPRCVCGMPTTENAACWRCRDQSETKFALTEMVKRAERAEIEVAALRTVLIEAEAQDAYEYDDTAAIVFDAGNSAGHRRVIVEFENGRFVIKCVDRTGMVKWGTLGNALAWAIEDTGRVLFDEVRALQEVARVARKFTTDDDTDAVSYAQRFASEMRAALNAVGATERKPPADTDANGGKLPVRDIADSPCGHVGPCVKRVVPADGRPIVAHLADGTKVVVRRDATTTGPAWLDVAPQAQVRPADEQHASEPERGGRCMRFFNVVRTLECGLALPCPRHGERAPETCGHCGYAGVEPHECGCVQPRAYHDAPKVEESRTAPEESPQGTEESR